MGSQRTSVLRKDTRHLLARAQLAQITSIFNRSQSQVKLIVRTKEYVIESCLFGFG
eukprot:COSAG01_NODE_25732_length_735_cov_1.069182_1_plen_55_part_01